MAIQLSDHFTYTKLFRFVLPSIGMMVFTSIYGVVDGYFVSNYAGDTSFAAINLIMPFLMLCAAVGFMFGTGGTALVSRYLGEKRAEDANRVFSLLTYFLIVLGIVLTVFGELFLKDVSLLLGATEELLPYCVEYGRYILITLTPFMLQNMFQSFLVAAEKPRFGFWITVVAGVINIILDWILVGVLRLGVSGAAAATCISQTTGGMIPLIYFLRPNHSRLKLGATKLDLSAIWITCSNGFSEFMSNLSMSGINMLYNLKLMQLIGQDGVSAFGVVMYVEFLFVSTFIGYAIGTAPIIGYNFGAGNEKEQKNIFAKSSLILLAASVAMCLGGMLLAKPISLLYVGYNDALCSLTARAFMLYSISFLLKGLNIYASSHFTALNNGLISALISFLRMFVFRVALVLLLPLSLGADGVWLSVAASELLSAVVSVAFLVANRKRYHYA